MVGKVWEVWEGLEGVEGGEFRCDVMLWDGEGGVFGSWDRAGKGGVGGWGCVWIISGSFV